MVHDTYSTMTMRKLLAPQQTHMEPQKESLENDFPSQTLDFQNSKVFGGVSKEPTQNHHKKKAWICLKCLEQEKQLLPNGGLMSLQSSHILRRWLRCPINLQNA